MSYWKSDGTAMKLWEQKCGIPGPAYIRAVPGGWIVRDAWSDEAGSVYVPDPTAPHCQPPPPADDRPPMTTNELDAWLREHHGPPEDRHVPTWMVRGKQLERFEDVWCYRGTIVPARDIGIMLWADRRWPAGDGNQ
jgi:hypothetical protein